ncbi:UNVERIFIED_ORG: uncharacterized protein YjbI with pentapeptide repeats [Actinomadura viridilutea]
MASPYSTGGGGSVLEHRYGAVLLSHLLIGDPIPELGADADPISIRFQDKISSPVDDLVAVGRTPDGAERWLSIGVRRAPKFTRSEAPTADLLVSYLRVVSANWEEVSAGRWRLGLAVASPNQAVQQIRELAVIARDQPDNAAFRTAVTTPGRISQDVRDRLTHFDALTKKAADKTKELPASIETAELSWRILHALWVRELRLEGVDETDASFTVARLRNIVPDGSVTAANDLFRALENLSRRYATSGAKVTETMLRQHLSGMRIQTTIIDWPFSSTPPTTQEKPKERPSNNSAAHGATEEGTEDAATDFTATLDGFPNAASSSHILAQFQSAAYALTERNDRTWRPALDTVELIGELYPKMRQRVINLFCTLLRCPTDSHDATFRKEVQAVLCRQLSGPLTLLGADRQGDQWTNLNLDLHGARLTDFQLEGAQIGKLDFPGAHLDGETSFSETIFVDHANFSNTTFAGQTYFARCQFNDGADFSGSSFLECSFGRSKFKGIANFGNSHHTQEASFRMILLNDTGIFDNANFCDGATFEGSDFRGDVRFVDTNFGPLGHFESVAFHQGVRFNRARATQFDFHEAVNLGGAIHSTNWPSGWMSFDMTCAAIVEDEHERKALVEPCTTCRHRSECRLAENAKQRLEEDFFGQ